MGNELLINAIKQKEILFAVKKKLGMSNNMSDEDYLKHFYKIMTGKKLDLQNPVTFNEKLQWLKLYNHVDEYTKMVDKYEVKKYVAEKIGEKYVANLIGVWDKIDDISFNDFPNQFVIKCTHDSQGLVICKDKTKFDVKKAKKKIDRCLKNDFFYSGREWPYKNVKPRIIAEEYLEDKESGELKDYKFFCFDGVPKIMYIAQGRGNGNSTTADFFDMEFNHLDLKIDHENAEVAPRKPINFERMKEFAKILSESIPHVRVDFYEVDGKVYFGELTFFHCGGFVPFKTPEWENTLGNWIDLPKNTI